MSRASDDSRAMSRYRILHEVSTLEQDRAARRKPRERSFGLRRMAGPSKVEAMELYRPKPLRPERLRFVERPFGWVPFRLLSSGLMAELGAGSVLLYFFLCLVADRQGLSYWGDERAGRVLGLCRAELERSRQQLCDRDLVAYSHGLYQVLSLPD